MKADISKLKLYQIYNLHEDLDLFLLSGLAEAKASKKNYVFFK